MKMKQLSSNVPRAGDNNQVVRQLLDKKRVCFVAGFFAPGQDGLAAHLKVPDASNPRDMDEAKAIATVHVCLGWALSQGVTDKLPRNWQPESRRMCLMTPICEKKPQVLQWGELWEQERSQRVCGAKAHGRMEALVSEISGMSNATDEDPPLDEFQVQELNRLRGEIVLAMSRVKEQSESLTAANAALTQMTRVVKVHAADDADAEMQALIDENNSCKLQMDKDKAMIDHLANCCKTVGEGDATFEEEDGKRKAVTVTPRTSTRRRLQGEFEAASVAQQGIWSVVGCVVLVVNNGFP